MTTHTTAMFHGPSGMLAPIPARISQACVPRTQPRPGMSAANTDPVATQATRPKTATRRICGSVRPWKASMTSW